MQLETDPEVRLWSMIAGVVAVFSEDDKLWFKPMFTSIVSDTLGKGRHQVDRWKDGRSDGFVVVVLVEDY